MGALADEYILVRADVSRIPRDVQKAGASAGTNFGKSFNSGAKKLLAAGLIFEGIRRVTGFLADANAEARESVKVGKVTAQVIKSTGGAAKVTSGQVGALATSISNATGKDDELVQSGANLLLTFKNVRNEVGKNNDIFNRATKSAVDLSATGFGSVAGSSKMLGKALNDPIRGITALQRAGVTFSDQQREQIRVMVKSGDVLGAQKLIMAEVESQVGGVAAASATAGEKMSVAFANFKEQVGTALLPVVNGFANVMVAHVFPALSTFVGWLSAKIPAAVKVLRPIFAQIAGQFRALGASEAVPALRSLAGFVTGTLVPAWASYYKLLGSQLVPILRQVGGFVVSSVIPAFRTVARFIASDVVPGFLSIVETVKALIRVVAPIISQIVGVIIDKFTEMRPQIASIWGSVKEIITGVMFIVKEVISSVTAIIKMIWDRWGTQIKAIVGAVFGAIFKIISGLMKAIAGVIKLVVALIKGDWKGAWNAIKQIFSGIWQAIWTILSQTLGRIFTTIGDRLTAIRSRWSDAWTRIKSTARSAMDWVHTKITGVLDKIKSAFQTAKDNIKKVWDGVKAVVQAPIVWVKDNVYNTPLRPVWNAVAKLVGADELPELARGGIAAYARGGIADLERYANGGTPFGVRPGYTPGRDTHPIMVGGGEAIMRPEWTRAVGPDYVNAANAAARRGSAGRFVAGREPAGFAGGGIVGWIKNKLGAAGAAVSGLAAKIKGFVLGGLRTAAGAILNPLKGVIDRSMPANGVGRTVGGIGKKGIDLLLDKIGGVDAAAVAATGGGQGDPGGPAGTGGRGTVSWKGGRFTERFRNTLIQAQGFAGRSIPVIQGGFRPRTSYSGTSHQGDAIDTLWSQAILSGLRRARVAAWHRTPAQGFSHHIHGVPLPGAGFPGGSGIWQAQDYLRGGNGLALGGIVRGGRGGITARIGEGRHDELVQPLPPNWQAGRSQPIVINIDLGDGVTQRVEGILDADNEFRASVGRMRR